MNQYIEIRSQFAFLWNDPEPNKVIVAARGSDKTVATLQYVLSSLLTGKPNGSAVFFSSTLKQVKSVVTPIMRQLLLNFEPDLWKFNHTENIYRFNSDKCAFGLRRLKEFKFKIDKQTGRKMDVTEHDDGNSHGADAFRYAAMAREIWNRDPTQGRTVIREDYNVLC